MLDKSYFKSYKNIKNGLNEAFCKGFFNLSEIKIKNIKYVSESLVFNKKEFDKLLSKYY